MQVPGIYLLVLRRLPAIVSAVPSAPDFPRPQLIRKILKELAYETTKVEHSFTERR